MNAAAKKPAALTLPQRCALRALGQAPTAALSTPGAPVSKRTLDSLVEAGRVTRHVGPGVGREVTTTYRLVPIDLRGRNEGDTIDIAAQDGGTYRATKCADVGGWLDQEGRAWRVIAGDMGRLSRERDALCGRAVELTPFSP